VGDQRVIDDERAHSKLVLQDFPPLAP